VDALETLGLLDQTALVVTADHGGEFWDHGQFEHGHTLYEELVHVPIVALAAGRGYRVRECRARVRDARWSGVVDMEEDVMSKLRTLGYAD